MSCLFSMGIFRISHLVVCLAHGIVCKTETEICRYTNDAVFISFGWSCMSILFIEIFYDIIVRWRVYGISFWCHSLSPVMKSQYNSMMSWLVLRIFLMEDILIFFKDSFWCHFYTMRLHGEIISSQNKPSEYKHDIKQVLNFIMR